MIDDAGLGVSEISIPAVAADASGNFFVVWHQRAASKLRQDGDGVFARRLDPSGVPTGDPFIVNDLPTGEPGDPEVSVDAQGDAVVVSVRGDETPGAEEGSTDDGSTQG